MILLMFAVVAAMAIGIPVAAYLYTVRRAREVQLLTTHGVSRQARVTELVYKMKGGIFRGITYQFEVAGGQAYRKFIALPSTEDVRFATGGTVEIVYLQSDPRISSLREIVDRTRKLHSKIKA
ncbi:MAG TPA: hypothetical protein VNJ02_01495 [Vicinamibacterales bacterium]|nr:hypothetical protein [Vicinamibacterales bacterium]